MDVLLYFGILIFLGVLAYFAFQKAQAQGTIGSFDKPLTDLTPEELQKRLLSSISLHMHLTPVMAVDTWRRGVPQKLPGARQAVFHSRALP